MATSRSTTRWSASRRTSRSATRSSTANSGDTEFRNSGDTEFRGHNTQFPIDDASRLQGLTHDLAGTGSDQVLGFGYNPASQIVSRTRSNAAWEFTEQVAGTKNYIVNGLNQYVTAGAASLGYDANGNLSSDGSNTYVYDAENRLVSVTGGTSVSLAYDPLGRLWQYSGPQSGTLRFVHDGDRLTVEYNSSGVVQRTHAFGPGVDEPLISYELTTPMRRFYHADHQGSIVAVADENGNALNIDKYDEWGVPSAGNWGRFQYTGQVFLPDLGLYYYKARIYSSRLGRFLQTDPIGYKDQVNLYEYVEEDPLDKTDPTGTETGNFSNGHMDAGVDHLPSLGEVASFVAGFVPVLGDALNIRDAVEHPSALTIGAAVVGVVPDAAGVAREAAGVSRAGSEAGAAARASSKIDRGTFAKERSAYWKAEARTNPSKYGDADLARMSKGKAPIGPDGHSMELHHSDRTHTGGVQPMSRTEHRLGDNYKKNHPD